MARRGAHPPPPPLPLLVLSDFSFASFCADGTLPGVSSRHVPLPERETGAAGSVRCVGSFEGWLVGVKLNEGRYFGDLRCFLMNVFSGDVVRLPPASSAAARLADAYSRSRSLPIVNGSGVVNCVTNSRQCVMSFCKVTLSSSPTAGSKYVVAAVIKDEAKLALWRPGMKSWCVCDGGCITKSSDIFFSQGKLCMVGIQSTANLFVFDISEDDDHLIVSRVEYREIERPEVTDSYHEMWSMVDWRGKLLIVGTYCNDAEFWQTVTEVRVFEADLSTNSVRLVEIESLDGDCICLSPCSSKLFRSCDYDGVGGDLIYYIDGCIFPDKNACPFDTGTMTPFAGDIPEDKLRAADG